MPSATPPSRRELLALASAAFGTSALAGCVGTASDQAGTATATGDGEATTDQATATEEATRTPLAMDGLVTVQREAPAADVVATISAAIEDSENLTLVTTVDHAENAAAVDRALPPTTVLVFGNPELGTQLMNERRTVAIDLPQKLLVLEEAAGTMVVYNDPTFLARRHGLTEADDVLDRIAGALDTLANVPVEATETD